MLSLEERNEKITENIGLVYKMLDLLYDSSLIENTAVNDYDDYYQTGMLGLMRAIESYDESKGVFSTYACICIKNSILTEYRTRFTNKQMLNFFCCQLEPDLEVIEEESPKILADIENISALRQTAARILKGHKRSNQAALGLEVMVKQYMGMTLSDAADALAVSYPKAKRALQYFRTLLKREDLSWTILS